MPFGLDCVVEDASDYEVTAVNSSNKAISPIEIVVYDKPGPPTGPVKFDSVSSDSIHLSWQPPTFIGGSPISSYIVEKREATSMVCMDICYIDLISRLCNYIIAGLVHCFCCLCSYHHQSTEIGQRHGICIQDQS